MQNKEYHQEIEALLDILTRLTAATWHKHHCNHYRGSLPHGRQIQVVQLLGVIALTLLDNRVVVGKLSFSIRDVFQPRVRNTLRVQDPCDLLLCPSFASLLSLRMHPPSPWFHTQHTLVHISKFLDKASLLSLSRLDSQSHSALSAPLFWFMVFNLRHKRTGFKPYTCNYQSIMWQREK